MLIMSGCAQAPTSSPHVNERPPTGPTSPSDEPIVELAGANVTWVGRGAVDLQVTVSGNISTLGFSWNITGHEGQPANGAAEFMGIHMDGCPDDPPFPSSGGAVAGRWCPNAPKGAHTATVTLYAGSFAGRVCVLGIPASNRSLSVCGAAASQVS